ncbi:MAG: Rieske 2Fe-2S domain-containing protein [Chloroflexota bacterium]
MASQAADANAVESGLSRREFLYYIWGASMALFAAQSTGLLVWFLIPRFREGEFGGLFPLAAGDVPETPSGEPINYPDGRFWLVNVDSGPEQSNELMYRVDDEPELKGVLAIYKVCTHLGCIYSWTPANNRFECPCHGSKYRLDGRRIEAPAPRTLDRFKILALDAGGAVLAESEVVDDFVQPLQLPDGTAEIAIDTGFRKQGPTQELLINFVTNSP